MTTDETQGLIADLKPYPEYMESGLPWLGKMPSHWARRRMKVLFRERAQKGFPDEPLLAATQNMGVVRKEDYGTRTVTAMKDFHLLKLVERGDFVISLRSFQGGIELAHCRGIISPAYTILTPRRDASQAYYARFFKSPAFISSLTLFVTGIREGQNIDYERLSRAYLPLPPPDEQQAIGLFLDWANGRLERTIRAKRKVIALLNEQKQAIIHRAVTRGLDPTVPLKPSGIPWLGDVPMHWEIWRINRCARVGNGSTPSRGKPAYWSNGSYPWLNSSQVNRGYINSADQFVTATALRECHLPRVPAGSVLVAITGQGKTRGTAALLGFEATINQHIAFVSPRMPVVSPEFLHLTFVAAYQTLRALSEDSGSTKGALTCDDLKRFKVVLPPLPEQTALVHHMHAETLTLQMAISRLEREIELLREYRTRLVADVVTGKLDVREAAARLPAAEGSEPMEDAVVPEDEIEIEDGVGGA
ncbi:MAG: restriction endonuclease subunit S [Thermoflexales bacterium]